MLGCRLACHPGSVMSSTTNPFQAFSFKRTTAASKLSPAEATAGSLTSSQAAAAAAEAGSLTSSQATAAAAAAEGSLTSSHATATAAAAPSISSPLGAAAAAASAAVSDGKQGRVDQAGKQPASTGKSRAQASSPERPRKQQRSALTGEPKGLQEKLGTGQPLRLILVGHNPSEYAWHVGHVYANPSNRFWPLLISTGIAPAGTTGPEADDTMPADVGVGFTDVGTGHPGTDSSQFTSKDFQHWRDSFYTRLQAHLQAACRTIGCTCGECGAPALVAFTGKRQYLELMNLDASGQPLKGKAKVATVQLGPQSADKLPPGWPLPASTEVWVLTSTSGAAPMSNADRERPYKQLAERLKDIPWPRVQLECRAGDGSTQL